MSDERFPLARSVRAERNKSAKRYISERDPVMGYEKHERDYIPPMFCACCLRPYRYSGQELRDLWATGRKIRCSSCRMRCNPQQLCRLES